MYTLYIRLFGRVYINREMNLIKIVKGEKQNTLCQFHRRIIAIYWYLFNIALQSWHKLETKDIQLKINRLKQYVFYHFYGTYGVHTELEIVLCNILILWTVISVNDLYSVQTQCRQEVQCTYLPVRFNINKFVGSSSVQLAKYTIYWLYEIAQYVWKTITYLKAKLK